MCKNTERLPCQQRHQNRMRSDQIQGPLQAVPLQQRRASNGKGSAQPRKPRQQPGRPEDRNNAANNRVRTPPHDRLSPVQNNHIKHIEQINSANNAGHTAKQGQTRSLSCSPRGYKRPCHSPNSVQHNNASTGSPARGPLTVTSPSKAHNQNTVDSSSTRSPPAKMPPVGIAYAGAKFSDPPSPKVLPKPPMHWVFPSVVPVEPRAACTEMTNVLRVMLKVQA